MPSKSIHVSANHKSSFFCMADNYIYVCVCVCVYLYTHIYGFPSGTSGRESTCQYRRHKRHSFNPWVRKIPWSRKWHPAPVFLPGKFQNSRAEEPGGLQSIGPQRVKHDWATEHTHTRHIFFLKLKKNIFIWLHWVLVTACGIFSLCIPHLYPFICWWVLRLLPYLGYCKSDYLLIVI